MTPPPYQRPRKNRALTIGIVILVLILVGAGTFGLLALLVKNNPQGKTTGTPTTTTRTTQVNTAATATAQVSQNPYSSNPSTLALIDPLQDNSRGYKWDEATLGGSGTCGFSGGAYHMTAPQPPGIICDPEAPQLTLSDLTFEAKVTVLQGDGASLVFRLSQAKGTGYYFDIDTQGNYEILAADANNHTRTLRSGSNSAIKKGTNQTNLVAVVAIGNSISVYVNNQFIDKATDSSYTQGQIGIGCFTNKGSADVAAIDAKVWKM